MLAHPEYDYAVTHPTSNLGAKITDEVREAKRVDVISIPFKITWTFVLLSWKKSL